MDLTHLQSTDVTATDTTDYSILDKTVIIRQHSHYQTTQSLSDTADCTRQHSHYQTTQSLSDNTVIIRHCRLQYTRQQSHYQTLQTTVY